MIFAPIFHCYKIIKPPYMTKQTAILRVQYIKNLRRRQLKIRQVNKPQRPRPAWPLRPSCACGTCRVAAGWPCNHPSCGPIFRGLAIFVFFLGANLDFMIAWGTVGASIPIAL